MAEKELKPYRINRLKLAKVASWAEKQDDSSLQFVPAAFAAGRHGSGLLTVPQKKDMLRHVVSMAASNKALFPHEVKQCMYRLCLLNKGIVKLEDIEHKELPWSDYEKYVPCIENIYKDWRAWVRHEFPDKLSLMNAKTCYKSAEEAASITPKTINQHFDELETMLLEAKLMDPETKRLTEAAGQCIWTMDEKGLSGDPGKHVKNKKALTAREVGATRCHKDSTFGHITLAPFVSLMGQTAPPFVFTKGASRLKAWGDVWPQATVIATDNGSVTTAWFVQILGLFGRFVREDLAIPTSQPVVLLMDSGGGAQLHISAEASLIAETFNVRPWYFRKYMTPAVCSLDQRPNKEAEAKFHAIRAAGFDMTGLGALHAAREESCQQFVEYFDSVLFSWRPSFAY